MREIEQDLIPVLEDDDKVFFNELFESLELVLRMPQFSSGMGVASSWETTDVFRKGLLITQDVHLLPPLALVLEPSAGHTLSQQACYQIEVDQWMDWWVSPEKDFPVVVNIFHDRSETNAEHCQVFEGLPVPIDFDLLSLRAALETLTW